MVNNVIRIKGGLGNQMFQYAFGLALRQRGRQTTYDVSWFQLDAESSGCTARDFGLDAFAIDEEWGCETDRFLLREGLSEWRERPENVFIRENLELEGKLITGYFQCSQYCEPIRSLLLERFTLRNPDAVPEYERWLERIRSVNAVSIHIRRGDYCAHGDVYASCSPDYYRRACRFIETRVADPVFFVFSDDLTWARQNLGLKGAVEYVDLAGRGGPQHELMLMSNCKHNIIANSTFSWWGAWLNRNPDKTVVAPLLWFSDGRMTDVLPPEWHRLPNAEWGTFERGSAQPKVSILIPVYNAAGSIDRALISSVSQSLQDIEIICLDDGSSDDSWLRLQKWTRQDSRVRLLRNEKNEGLLLARKHLVAAARGNYVCFLDADDFLPVRACEAAYAEAEEHQVELVHGRFRVVFSKVERDCDRAWFAALNARCTGHLEGHDELLSNMFLKDGNGYRVWGKLYSRQLLMRVYADLPDVRIVMAEDALASFLIYGYARSCWFSEEELYVYSSGCGVSSSCADFTAFLKWCDQLDVCRILKKIISDKPDQFIQGEKCLDAVTHLLTDSICQHMKAIENYEDRRRACKHLLECVGVFGFVMLLTRNWLNPFKSSSRHELVGQAVTWPFRMVLNSFRCYRDNGFVYTLRRIPVKFSNLYRRFL